MIAMKWVIMIVFALSNGEESGPHFSSLSFTTKAACEVVLKSDANEKALHLIAAQIETMEREHHQDSSIKIIEFINECVQEELGVPAA